MDIKFVYTPLEENSKFPLSINILDHTEKLWLVAYANSEEELAKFNSFKHVYDVRVIDGERYSIEIATGIN